MRYRIFVSIVLSLIVVQTGISAEFNGKILMRVNNHDYLLDDILGKYLIQEWEASRDIISEEG